MVEIDARGLGCPQPVLMAKEAIGKLGDEGNLLVIIVNDPASCENVERYARGQGCSVKTVRKGEEYHIRIEKPTFLGESTALKDQKPERTVVYVNSSLLGVGNEALGSILMRNFLKTLLDLTNKPNRLIFINSGVQLACEGSEVLEALQAFSDAGVEILSCGTCLDFYGLKEKLRVGRVSNMYEIAQSLLEADRLIRP